MTTIRIHDFDYELVFSPRLQDEVGEPCTGLHDYTRTRIEIEQDASPAVRHQAVWHEILHAVLVAAGIEEKKHKEDVIDAAAHGIVQVLRDNPWLITPETLAEMTRNKSLDNP